MYNCLNRSNSIFFVYKIKHIILYLINVVLLGIFLNFIEIVIISMSGCPQLLHIQSWKNLGREWAHMTGLKARTNGVNSVLKFESVRLGDTELASVL